MKVIEKICGVILITIFTFSFFEINSVKAQKWQSINGPLESDVRDVVIKNDSIYVASGSGGLFKKALDSSQWLYSEIAEGEGPFRNGIASFLSFNLDNNKTYYAGGGGTVTIGDRQTYNHFFISNDYGKTWSEFRNGIESDHTIEDIFISEGGDIFIGCVGGILKFNEEENLFKEVGNTYWAYTFFQQEDTLIAGTIEGIEYSVDGGDNWTTTGPDSLRVFSLSHAQNEYFMGTNHGLFHTKDLKQSWNVVENLPKTPVNALYNFQNKVVAGTDSGAFIVSPDNFGVEPVFPELDNQSINVINSVDDVLYVGSGTGLYLCSLEGNSCALDGVPSSRIRSMSFQNNDTLLVGTSSKIHRYSIPESQWDSLTIPIERARSMISVKTDSFVSISRSYFLNCSFEYGACDSTQVDPGKTLLNLTKNSAGDLFLVSSSTVFQSKNYGNTWNPIFNFETNSRNFRSPIFSVSDSLLFIDAAEQGLVKYSLNTGDFSIIGFEGTGINASFMASDGVIYVSAFYSIHKSTNLGETWEALLQPEDVLGSDILINVLYDEAAEKLYAIATEGRVYISENGGANWGVNKEMDPIYMESATIGNDGTLYLGTRNAGIFTHTKPLTPPITISNEKEPATATSPNTFTLRQNYPNPFNPTTTIPFELTQTQTVQISVYNVFGQQVQTVALGARNSGSHSFNLNLSNQASGMYFVKVKAGNQSQTIKITLIK